MKKVLIMAGGTGGHIFPALAVADVLASKGMAIQWLGTRKGLESKLIPEHHFPIEYIDIAGLRGKSIASFLVLPYRLVKSMMQTITVFNKVKPDVVLGMGGFVTGPGGVVAWLFRKPLILHEQNAIPGLTNKLLFSLAKRVFTAFPNTFKTTGKVAVVGNPVRKDITNLHSRENIDNDEQNLKTDSHTLKILVVGGSLGALVLNEVIPASLILIIEKKLLIASDYDGIEIVHQCGEKHYQVTMANYQLLTQCQDVKVTVTKFIVDMAANYSQADIVICRAGALTVSEIAAAGIASILIPYPHAVDDHQTENAKYLVANNAAVLMPQPQLNKESLAHLLVSLNKEQLKQMAINARKLAINNAAEIVAEQCIELAGKIDE